MRQATGNDVVWQRSSVHSRKVSLTASAAIRVLTNIARPRVAPPIHVAVVIGEPSLGVVAPAFSSVAVVTRAPKKLIVAWASETANKAAAGVSVPLIRHAAVSALIAPSVATRI